MSRQKMPPKERSCSGTVNRCVDSTRASPCRRKCSASSLQEIQTLGCRPPFGSPAERKEASLQGASRTNDKIGLKDEVQALLRSTASCDESVVLLTAGLCVPPIQFLHRQFSSWDNLVVAWHWGEVTLQTEDHAILYHNMPYHNIPCYTISYHTRLYYTMLVQCP